MSAEALGTLALVAAALGGLWLHGWMSWRAGWRRGVAEATSLVTGKTGRCATTQLAGLYEAARVLGELAHRGPK
jgi:hypothetical protein